MAASRQVSPAPITHNTLRQYGVIRFLHPGYPAPTNVLLALPRVDLVALASETTTTTHGVHYQTALLACQIIANNTFATGRLTLDQAGQQLVDLPLDGILTKDTYYFLVSDSPDQYPVIASFQDWQFPHDRIPDSWPTLLPSDEIHRCCITNFPGPLDRAYLVPQEEGTWFLKNDMGRYGVPIEDTIHNSANILPLRRDIHTCFDNRLLAIVPKAFAPTLGSSQYIAFFISSNDTAAVYWHTYHDCLVQYLHEYSRPYLFARFAWAILFYVKRFVVSGITRRVVVRTEDKDGNVKYDTKVLNGAQLIASYSGGGSRGSKPSRSRRSRADNTRADNTRADNTRADNTRADNTRADNTRADNTRADNTRADNTRADNTRADNTREEDEDSLESYSEDCDTDSIWDTEWRGEGRRQQNSSNETAPDIGPQQLPADVEGELRDTLAKIIPTTSQEDPQEIEL